MPEKPEPRRKPRLTTDTDPNIMPDPNSSFDYIVRPTSDGDRITTQPSYRGTKTKGEVIAEITARLGADPIGIEPVVRLFQEVVVDWTIGGWKIEAIDGLISYRDTSGGSKPMGATEDWDFDNMNLSLSCQWGPAGEARARALFSASKVGEQNRVVPVFSEVFDSDSGTPNHYVVGHGLTCRFANRTFKFDLTRGCKLRFQKSDGTWVDAASYPYIKGNTVVCIPPAGLTGAVSLEVHACIGEAMRSAVYPFPLT